MKTPYLSIVIAGRNDNYGGDFVERLQRCLDWNTQLLEKNKVSSEFILVNWNPIPENKPLEELVRFAGNRKYVKFRIITVAQDIHQHYIDPSVRLTVPVFEFIAKNAGIRRATGEYILCINADILIHPQIIRYIAEEKINKEYYYRANRLDYTKTSAPGSVKELYQAGYIVSMKGFNYRFNSFPGKKLQYAIFREINSIRLSWELWKFRNHKLCNALKLPVTYDNAEYYAHCLNSGDFMLMHRLHWLELHAYPENTMVSTHTDAIFTVFAHYKLKECIFSFPIFHQEHERRYSWDAIKHENLFLDAYHKFEEIAKSIRLNNNTNDYLNDENWGLKQFNLPENEY